LPPFFFAQKGLPRASAFRSIYFLIVGVEMICRAFSFSPFSMLAHCRRTLEPPFFLLFKSRIPGQDRFGCFLVQFPILFFRFRFPFPEVPRSRLSGTIFFLFFLARPMGLLTLHAFFFLPPPALTDVGPCPVGQPRPGSPRRICVKLVLFQQLSVFFFSFATLRRAAER